MKIHPTKNLRLENDSCEENYNSNFSPNLELLQENKT